MYPGGAREVRALGSWCTGVPVSGFVGESPSRHQREVQFSVCHNVRDIPTLDLTVQRTLAVDFVFDCDKLSALFVNCLATFPNLHTLEIGSTPNGLVLESLTTTALGKRKLPVRTLALPPTAHFLLRYCPNIEDLTCGPTAPTEAFVESLVVGGLNLVTKLSVSCRGGWSDTGPSVDICPSRVYPVSH